MKKRSYFLFGLILCIGIGIGYILFHQEPAIYRADVYFSPEGQVGKRIVSAINETKETLDIAIFDFTASEIQAALEQAKKKGVKIRIIADSRQAKGSHSVVEAMKQEGFDIKITHGKQRGIMHNKFAVFDGRIVVTGSYNWTSNAENYNYENAIFLTDPKVIKTYQNEFSEIWNFVPKNSKKE